MKKFFSLIRACITSDMQIFNVKTRSNNKFIRFIVPIILCLISMSSVAFYAYTFILPLINIHAEYILLSVFIIVSFFLTLIEGIYKASGLLFNCSDDALLFSLPIKKSYILFVRIFKFYLFELMYNSIFMLPAIIVYILFVKVNFSFYIVSLFVLLLVPVIPIIISCILSSIILKISSKFKFKNFVQIVITIIILGMIFFFSFNMKGFINSFEDNATSINDVITKLYYPCRAYVKMTTNFRISDLLFFIFMHIIMFTLLILGLSRFYFKISSNVKIVRNDTVNKKYIIKKNKPIVSLIKKEFKKFFGSPVFIINTGIGLVLFIVGIIAITINFDKLASHIALDEYISLSIEEIKNYMPIILYGFVCFSSFMTSITSSMISLEGNSFDILKSLPIKPITVILSKILMAILVMAPTMLLSDIVVFVKFKFNIYEILLIILGTILLPFISETIGIIVNLKYPKMNAKNDTEVVKQSMSSMIAVFLGMLLAVISVFCLYYFITLGFSNVLILVIINLIFSAVFGVLLLYMKKNSVRLFNEICV